MKLIKSDIFKIIGCLRAIKNFTILNLCNDIDIISIKNILENSTQIGVDTITNLSGVWEKNDFESDKFYYYKRYELRLITNNTIEVLLLADKNFIVTMVDFDLSNIIKGLEI